MTPDSDVLIAGAGPTGLTAAIELARRGITVRVVDREAPRAPSESRALSISAYTQELFERAGLLAPVRAQAQTMRGLTIYRKGRLLGRLYMQGLDSPHPAMVLLRQAETEQILLERLAELGVRVERPVELTGVRQDDAAVYASVTRANDEAQELTAAYLIGADGARSRVRKALGLAFDGERSGVREYLADCTIEWRGTSRHFAMAAGELIIVLGPPHFLMFGYIGGGLWRMLVMAPADDPSLRHDQPTQQVLQHSIDASPDLDARLRDVTWSSSFGQRARKVEQLRHGRIFLAGDAAQIQSPFGGQGMNAGIADAANLGWKLALHLHGYGDDALLNSVLWSWGRFAPGTRLARRFLGGYLDQYRRSPIVEDHIRTGKHRGPGAGVRAPDAGGVLFRGRVGRLFECWTDDPRHQLLIVAGAQATPARHAQLRMLAAALDQRYGAVVRSTFVAKQRDSGDNDALLDLSGEVYGRYGAHEDRLYLVRPDGFIGFRSNVATLRAFHAHLARLFHSYAREHPVNAATATARETAAVQQHR